MKLVEEDEKFRIQGYQVDTSIWRTEDQRNESKVDLWVPYPSEWP